MPWIRKRPDRSASSRRLGTSLPGASLFMKLAWDTKSFSGYKFELIASFAGTGWSGAVQLACVRLFIKLMGIEAYGLIGFYLVLQPTLQVLDLGLSPTMNREM